MSVGSVLATTYVHLIASVILVFLSAQNQLFPDNIFIVILILIALIGLLIGMLKLNPGPLKYILFIVITVLWGQILRDRFEKAKQKGILTDICISVFGIFLGMTIISFLAGDRVLGFGPYFLAALTGLIISRFALLGLFLLGNTDISQAESISKMLSLLGSILFAGYIAFDTRRLVASAKRNEKQDYVNNSMSFFFDIINLFTSIEDMKK